MQNIYKRQTPANCINLSQVPCGEDVFDDISMVNL